MIFSRYSKPLRGTRILQALGCMLAAVVLIAALGQPTPAAAASTGRSQVPRAPHDDGSGALTLSSAAARALTDGAFAPVTGDVTASGVSAAAEIPVVWGGQYYWFGEYLCVDGYVWNDTASAVGPVAVEILVQTSDEVTTLADDVVYAYAYRLLPDEDASFIHLIHLPAYAGSEMHVEAAAWGTSPAAITAVNLTYVSGSYVAGENGSRVWTCYFKNNSPVTVKAPVVGGWEFDTDWNVYDSVFGFEQVTQVPPGGTLEIEAYGLLHLAANPANTYFYCQALAVPKPVYRFYNSRLGTHFYTASEAEKENVKATLSHIFTFEGPAYYMNPVANTQPLHRFYLKSNGTHFYTANEAEKANVQAKLSHVYQYEGPAYNVSSAPGAGRTTVYRFYHRSNGTHFYTASEAEKAHVQNNLSHVYGYEGPAFWIGQ